MRTNTVGGFYKKVHKELFGNIVPFWLTYSIDFKYGGFFGRISNDLKIEKKAYKSLILTSRILWSFSALHRTEKNTDFLKVANHGYAFLVEKFLDEKYGGTYWLVDNKGSVLDTKKKIYGQAFSIYALVEYYSASGEKEAIKHAKEIFRLIEKNNYDIINKGYFEASKRDWSSTEESQLSEDDMNEVKSMNTHLHLMEAYTALYRVWPNNELKLKLKELINVFIDFIIDPNTFHLKLFFEEQWRVKSNGISFGHDIEASWLIFETISVLDDSKLKAKVQDIVLKMVDITLKEGVSDKCEIYTNIDEKGALCKNIQWWQQAEFIVGLLNAYDISENEYYLSKAQRAWRVVEESFVDRENGEWFYQIGADGIENLKCYKVSEWKGPYHNVRACLEILRRLS